MKDPHDPKDNRVEHPSVYQGDEVRPTDIHGPIAGHGLAFVCPNRQCSGFGVDRCPESLDDGTTLKCDQCGHGAVVTLHDAAEPLTDYRALLAKYKEHVKQEAVWHMCLIDEDREKGRYMTTFTDAEWRALQEA